MSAKSSIEKIRHVLLPLLSIFLACTACHSTPTGLADRELAQRVVELEQHEGWHILSSIKWTISLICPNLPPRES